MFSSQELENLCTVSSERGMQHAPLNRVKISVNMARITTTWLGREVSCAHFPKTRSTWTNGPASFVMGQAIRGNAVLLGVSPDDIIHEQSRPKTWASLARQLPKTVELDDRAKQRIAQEQLDRSTAWREYYQRKAARRRGVNRDTATINLSTGEVVGEMTDAERQAAEEADAAFAEWNVEEELLQELPEEELELSGN
jgi:hypothetical protein